MLFCVILLWLQAAAGPPAAQQHLKKGYELLRRGDAPSAEAEARQAVKLAPDNAVALAFLGMVLSQREKPEEAIPLFERALKLDPSDSGTRFNLAVTYHRAKSPEKARQTLAGFLVHPAAPGVVFQAAKAAALSGDFDLAAKLFESIRSTYPDRVSLGYELAQVYYRTGRYDDSRATLLWTIAGGARDARLYRLLAWTFQRQNRPAEAVRTMLQAIDLDPSTDAGHAELGMILIEQGRYPDAYDVAQRAIGKMPSSAAAYKVKGQAEGYLNNPRKTLDSFKRAAELDPNDAEALLLAAQAQANLLLFAEALATYEKGIARFPLNARFYEGCGQTLLQPSTGPDASVELRARAMLEKALALDNSLPDAHYELGKLLLAKDNPRDALPHLETAAKLKPASSQFFFTLAGAYRELGREDDYRKALETYKRLQAGEQDR